MNWTYVNDSDMVARDMIRGFGEWRKLSREWDERQGILEDKVAWYTQTEEGRQELAELKEAEVERYARLVKRQEKYEEFQELEKEKPCGGKFWYYFL